MTTGHVSFHLTVLNNRKLYVQFVYQFPCDVLSPFICPFQSTAFEKKVFVYLNQFISGHGNLEAQNVTSLYISFTFVLRFVRRKKILFSRCKFDILVSVLWKEF